MKVNRLHMIQAYVAAMQNAGMHAGEIPDPSELLKLIAGCSTGFKGEHRELFKLELQHARSVKWDDPYLVIYTPSGLPINAMQTPRKAFPYGVSYWELSTESGLVKPYRKPQAIHYFAEDAMLDADRLATLIRQKSEHPVLKWLKKWTLVRVRVSQIHPPQYRHSGHDYCDTWLTYRRALLSALDVRLVRLGWKPVKDRSGDSPRGTHYTYRFVEEQLLPDMSFVEESGLLSSIFNQVEQEVSRCATVGVVHDFSRQYITCCGSWRQSHADAEAPSTAPSVIVKVPEQGVFSVGFPRPPYLKATPAYRYGKFPPADCDHVDVREFERSDRGGRNLFPGPYVS